ncbi:MAG TPA: hypothetical protein VL971_04315 [Rhizomicrobium sp.]|nr:hypothetical protein [Rhizomicrobium sp.]
MSALAEASQDLVPAPVEQRLFELSPVGTLATTAVLLVLLFGSFIGVAAIEHVAILHKGSETAGFSDAAWPALVLSLLCVTALGMQRYARLADAREAPAYARILTGGMASAIDVTQANARGTRLLPATLIGLAFGIAASVWIRISELREGHVIPIGAMLWYGAATTLLTILFARGVEQTRAGNRGYGEMLKAELKIDLLRTDTLAVLGRSAARTALIWFVISAVAFLFLVGGDLDGLTIGLIAACAAMGVGMFVSTMLRIHHQIRAAKDAELEHIRRQIDAARDGLHTDATAAGRIHGLIAYEKRIEDAPEWPFDQSTLVRVGAYILIPTVPWFGQAVAGYMIEHLAH